MITKEISTRESCCCDACRSACQSKPGWFKPGEAEKVAAFFNISLEELFATQLMVDWWEDTGDMPLTFMLSPAMVGKKTGEEAPAEPNGRCVFFIDNKCSIHPVKPYECAQLFHGDTENYHKLAAMSWNDVQHQQQVKMLLGREPVEKPYQSLFSRLVSIHD